MVTDAILAGSTESQLFMGEKLTSYALKTNLSAIKFRVKAGLQDTGRQSNC
jgi:hypothetical protein